MALWPEAWRNNLPWAGASTAFDNITDIHGVDLPALGGLVGGVENTVLAQERCIERLVCVPTETNIDLFEVSGGPIIITELVGIVTTQIGGVTECQIVATPTAPGVGVNFSTAVDIDAQDVGASITFTDAALPVLTPTANGAVLQFPRHYWLCPVGVITAEFSATQTGNIAWYMVFKPLSPNTTVVSA